MSVEVAIETVAKTTGEGPHWVDDTKSLLFVDLNSGYINNWNSETKETQCYCFGKSATFIVPRSRGGYVIGLEREMVQMTVDWDNRSVSDVITLAEVDHGKDHRLNDGKCDPAGRLWTGTMPYERGKAGEVPLGQASLYSLDTEGHVVTRESHVTLSNGLAWSADHSTMFFIDSVPGKIYAYKYDVTTGGISDRQEAVDYSEHSDVTGLPDGMCIDREDRLWVANYFGGSVTCWDAIQGKRLRTVDIPASRTTSCCWGGVNHDELYVTSGGPFNMAADEVSRYPLAGSVFKVTGLGTSGPPAHTYNG